MREAPKTIFGVLKVAGVIFLVVLFIAIVVDHGWFYALVCVVIVGGVIQRISEAFSGGRPSNKDGVPCCRICGSTSLTAVVKDGCTYVVCLKCGHEERA